MRISDWSSDVCSSDLLTGLGLDAETAGDANQGQRCLGTRTGDLECGGASGLGQRPVRQERATPRGDRVAATTGDHLGREATNWPALLVEQTGLAGQRLTVLDPPQDIAAALADTVALHHRHLALGAEAPRNRKAAG